MTRSDDVIAALGRSRVLMGSGTIEHPNVMAIGWGSPGIIWGREVFVVLVRPSRWTHRRVEETGEFTINLLPAGMEESVSYCGTVSGRDHDKFGETGLTARPGREVSAPLVAQATVAYECRVIHRCEVIPETLAEGIAPQLYPDGDFHTIYFGEIVVAHE